MKMKRKDSLVSVVIPCYNSEKYIEPSISALKCQSYQNWEAIFVNDGSWDSTEELLQEASLLDDRIRHYSQPNQGAAKARELGISKATGDLIVFLDVDDTLEFKALEIMVDAFERDVDIVVAGYNFVKSNQIVGYRIWNKDLLGNVTYLKKLLSGCYSWELWAKMYRRELFDKPLEIPSEIRIGEDAAVFIQLVCRSRKVRILSDRVYNYIQYPQSASHVKTEKYAEETLQAAFFIENLLKKVPFYEQIRKEIDAMFLLFYSNSSRKKRLKHSHPLVSKLWKEHFNLSAFHKIPFYKAVYISLHYLCGFCR